MNKDTPGYKLIIGGFGFNNLGDEAILSQTLRTLGKGETFIALSPDPGLTMALHSLDVHQIRQKLRVPNILSYFRYIIEPHRPTLELIYRCKEIINVGGGNLTSYDKDALYHKLLIYSWATRLNKPVYFGAQTIGPLNKLDIFLLKKQLIKMVLPHGIPVRDEMSMGILREMNSFIPSKYAKDDAFHFEPKSSTDVPISGTFDNHPEGYNIIKIGVNLKGSIDMYGGNPEAVFDIVHTLCKFLLRRYHNIEIHPIYTSTDGKELKYLWKLRDKLKDARVSEIMPLTSADEVKYSVSKMDVCIGTRYHFCVFALASDIPCVAIHSGDYQKAKLQGLLLTNDIDTKNLKVIDADYNTKDALILHKTLSFLYSVVKYKGGKDKKTKMSSKRIVESPTLKKKG